MCSLKGREMLFLPQILQVTSGPQLLGDNLMPTHNGNMPRKKEQRQRLEHEEAKTTADRQTGTS